MEWWRVKLFHYPLSLSLIGQFIRKFCSNFSLFEPGSLKELEKSEQRCQVFMVFPSKCGEIGLQTLIEVHVNRLRYPDYKWTPKRRKKNNDPSAIGEMHHVSSREWSRHFFKLQELNITSTQEKLIYPLFSFRA